MVETKRFKTKLCVLYERGRCARQSCTFAHGDAELRRPRAFFTDRQSERGNDLRNKLDRKRSPQNYSPGRDSHSFRSNSRFSPPPPVKRGRFRSYEHTDGQSDLYRNFGGGDGTSDHVKGKKSVLSESRSMVEDERRQVKYEVDVLLDEKSQLKIELEERVQEADSLSSRIRDLEVQLSEEKAKFRRFNSKIRMLIRAHGHYSRLQDKIKRSQLQLEQLVKELGKDATQIETSEDHMNVNIISDEEVREFKVHACPKERHLPCSLEVPQGSNSGSLHLPVVSPDNTVRGHGSRDEAIGRHSLIGLNGNRVVEVGDKRGVIARPSIESKPKRRKDASKKYGSSDALKGWESNIVAPPTSMAAHANDEFVDQEADESTEADGTVSGTLSGLPFPLPPLPPITENAYLQYEGDDENVNVDGLDVC